MKRRAFIKNTSALALSVGVFGNIRWDGSKFDGDTPTTSDILGPFYRPGAPFRTNINPRDFKGPLLHVTGTIRQEDAKTPFNDCYIEIWQCNAQGEYDNVSDDYLYRGAAKTGRDGRYEFTTTRPVPYPAEPGGNIYRPAHIHMRIAGGAGNQDLITQIYFTNDPYLSGDPSTSHSAAEHRILDLQKNSKGEEVLLFDIVMKQEYPLDDATYQKIAGLYDVGNGNKLMFSKQGNLLFCALNGQIIEAFSYKGNYLFKGGNDTNKVQFELLSQGTVRVKLVRLRYAERKVYTYDGTKILKYRD
jgi:catechol 1,2-dioxygenase